MKSLKMYFTKKAILNGLAKFAMILIAVTISNVMYGQITQTNDSLNPFDGATPNASLIIDYALQLIASFTLIWGEIAKALNLKTKVKEIVFVVAGGGLALAGVLINFGLVDSLPAIFSIFSALGLFDLLKASKRTVQRYFPWA